MERIGTLRTLRRYPVKSMAGEDLAEARVTYAGLAGDRVYAFVVNRNQSDFPWMTGRLGREMILFRPRFLSAPATDDGQPDPAHFATEVTAPEGETFRANDPAFTQYLEKRFKRSLRLRFSERSMTDACPVSVLSYATIQALGTETGMTLDPRRFRANFYVQWNDERPFFEDSLVGKSLQIGETVGLHVVKKDSRCVMITIDPDTAEPAKQVLEVVSRKHGGCTGVYGAVLREGIVRVNDPVYVV
jgi:hypothetical protein